MISGMTNDRTSVQEVAGERERLRRDGARLVKDDCSHVLLSPTVTSVHERS